MQIRVLGKIRLLGKIFSICSLLFVSFNVFAVDVFTKGFSGDEFQNSLKTGSPITAIEIKLPKSLNHILATSNNFESTESNIISRYIIDGVTASRNEYSEYALITVFDGSNLFVICGGTMIAPNKVLTAAHCLQAPSNFEYIVIPNFYSFNDTLTAADLEPARRLSTHPDYSPSVVGAYDLGVITLNDSVSGPYAKLHSGSDKFVGDTGTVVGVGLTNSIDETRPQTLQKVSAIIVSNQACNESWQTVAGIEPASESVICAGYTTDGRGTCNGDSGGPLWNEIRGQSVLVGAVSFGLSPCESNRATQGYARVSSMTDFIQSESPETEFVKSSEVPPIGAIMMLLSDSDDASESLPPVAEIYISSEGTLKSYTESGEEIEEVAITGLGDIRDTRDLIVLEDGRVAIINSQDFPTTERLSIYDPNNKTWQHLTHTDWSLALNGTYGGIAALGDNVYVTDNRNNDNGIIVFDLTDGSSQRSIINAIGYIDITLGLNGKLYALQSIGGVVDVIDPIDMEILTTFQFATASGSRAVTADSFGNTYIATWDGNVIKVNISGEFVTSVDLGDTLYDIDIRADDKLIVTDGGGHLYNRGSVFLMDTSFNNIESFETDGDGFSHFEGSFGAFAN